MKKVLLLFGGNSDEHAVSCNSVKSVYEHIDRKKFEPTLVGITKQNEWLIYEDELDDLVYEKWEKKAKKINNIIIFLAQFDIVFPLIHGRNGEDGRLQGLFDLFGLSYVGCDTLASAIGMDKEITKIMLDEAEITQVPYLVVKSLDEVPKIKRSLHYPVIVKPANGGSSIGIRKVNQANKLKSAIKEALKYDNKIIVEQFIQAQELECAIIEERGHLYASTVGEILPAKEFYDYEAKYADIGSQAQIPAHISEEISREIRETAKKAFRRIGAHGMARVDFFYDNEGKQLYLNEINTIPGFTTISMYPQLLMYDGFTYQELLTRLLENATSH